MYIEFVVGHGQWAFADDDRQKDKRREDGETGVVIRIGNGKQMEESGRNNRPVRLDLSAESAAIQQCFSLTTNQRTVLSAQ
jgi:hypothetical protein